MKVSIDQEEWYPVHILSDQAGYLDLDYEIPELLWHEYTVALERWNEVQDMIKFAYDKQNEERKKRESLKGLQT